MVTVLRTEGCIGAFRAGSVKRVHPLGPPKLADGSDSRKPHIRVPLLKCASVVNRGRQALPHRRQVVEGFRAVTPGGSDMLKLSVIITSVAEIQNGAPGTM